MVKNSIPIFYEGDGKIRTETKIADPKKSVEENTYTRAQAECNDTIVCYLDDPYEGEMFAMMMTLFAPFSSPKEKDNIWTLKRAKLQPADLNVRYNNTDYKITVQKGWWYSAHEIWKYLFLPYTDSTLNRKLFINGEKARTWDAYNQGR